MADRIEELERLAQNYQEYTDGLVAQLGRVLSQLRECAEILGAEQIDPHRAMRAYADSVALLVETPHISRIDGANDSVTRQQRSE